MERITLEGSEMRFKTLLERDDTHPSDVERHALFFILSANEDNYNKVNHIYDFEDHSIKFECLEDESADFSSGVQKLIKLAFNLYNGSPADVLEIFSVLDEENFEIALSAIKIRFNRR